MKKLLLITIILFVSCESPGLSEVDSETFQKNVQTIKDTWIAGYMEGDFDKVVSLMVTEFGGMDLMDQQLELRY